MPDYSKGKIYAIRAPGTDDIYIGSTTVALSRRMTQHRSEVKQGNATCSSKLIIEREGSYIELIEEFPCENKEQLNKREGELIRATQNAVNRHVAGRTPQEWRNENKEVMAEKEAKWYQENKQYVLDKQKLYYEKNKDTILQKQSEYLQRPEVIERIKEYNNRPEVIERRNRLARERRQAKKEICRNVDGTTLSG